MAGINMMPMWKGRARNASEAEMQKAVDEFIRYERGENHTVSGGKIAGQWGLFPFNKPYFIKEDDFYCAYCSSGAICPPFIAVTAFQKSKLRPDQVDFMERKCRETQAATH